MMLRIALGLAIVTLFVGTMLLAARLKRSRPDIMVPARDAAMFVSGWSRSDLDKILADFGRKYDLEPSAFAFAEDRAGIWKVSPRQDMLWAQFLYLVNYVCYPEGFDLDGRRIAAVGRCRLPEGPTYADGVPAGETAWVYMPDQDSDYDLAYARLTNGRAFRIPFTTLAWQPVPDARLNAATLSLMG